MPRLLPGWVVLLSAYVVLLDIPRAAVASPWSEDAGSDISAVAVNLTRSFLKNQTCGVRDPGAWQQLEARVQREAVRIINAYDAAALDDSTMLRFQQDPVASTPQNYYYSRRYREQNFAGAISIVPTPPFANHTTITNETYTTITIPADIRWSDVSGQGQESIASPDPSVLFHPWFMYYRRDVLAKFNMTVPSTWDGLLAAASYINGTDIDGDGEGEYAVCFNSNYHCQQSYMLLAIFASMVQTLPKTSPAYTGVWFNATGPALEPLVNNSAMVRALDIYARLSAFNHPIAPDACGVHSEEFAAGKCVFAFNLEQFRMTRANEPSMRPGDPGPPILGRLGTALCPGSPYVLDPASDTLVACSAATCPLSYSPPDAPPAPRINRAPLNLAIRTNFIISSAASVTVLAFRYNYFQFSLMDWSATYVGPILTAVNIRTPDSPASDAPPAAAPANSTSAPAKASPSRSPRRRSPSSPAGRHQGNAHAPPPSSPSRISSPVPLPPGALSPPGGRRLLQQQPPAGPTAAPSDKQLAGLGVGGWPYNVTGLVAKGWHPDDALSFIRALQDVWSHPNTVMDNYMPGSAYFRLALADAATNATQPGADGAAIAGTLAAQWALVAASFRNPQESRRLYRSCMGMLPDNGTTATTTTAGGGGGRDWRPAYTAAAVSVVCGALAAVLLAGLVLRARAQKRTLLGAVIPPGTGASTTLLVTDIQNSTVMWEQLPAPLMEEVLRVHHATLRSLLDRHRGYESATEGDSFILAFHCPADALAYAMAAQAALLDAEWPADLLARHAEAAPVHSAVVKGNPEVELSYVVRRLQAGAAAADTHSLASHMAALRSTVRVSAASPPPSPTTPSCGPLRAAATRCTDALAAMAHRLVPALRRRAAVRQHELRNAAWGGSLLAGEGEGGEEGAAHEAVSSSLSSATASGRTSATTFGWALSQAWVQPEGEEVPPKLGVPSPATAVIWRGLRVRIGIHSGLSDPLQVSYNRASRRVQYSGTFADTAKAVADAAHGGQVLLSDSAFALLSAEDKAAAQLIMMLGEFEVAPGEKAAVPLYVAVPRVLSPRMRCFPPLRAPRTPLPGVLEAPIGVVTIVFMKATGVATLMAWDAPLTQAALALYHSTVSVLVPRYSGYVVEMADELALLAFQRPEAAIGWALAAQAALLEAPWAQELLEHELCEPITTTLVAAAAADSKQVVRRLAVHSRGLRLKVGVAMGAVVDSVNEATGRMAYRGKVMNRAARITSAASTGQVLTHGEAWGVAAASVLVADEGITATSTGLHALKGIRHATELFSCTYISQGSGLEAISSLERLPLEPSLPLPPHAAPPLDPAATADSSILLAAAGSQGSAPSSSRSPSPPARLGSSSPPSPTAPLASPFSPAPLSPAAPPVPDDTIPVRDTDTPKASAGEAAAKGSDDGYKAPAV